MADDLVHAATYDGVETLSHLRGDLQAAWQDYRDRLDGDYAASFTEAFTVQQGPGFDGRKEVLRVDGNRYHARFEQPHPGTDLEDTIICQLYRRQDSVIDPVTDWLPVAADADTARDDFLQEQYAALCDRVPDHA